MNKHTAKPWSIQIEFEKPQTNGVLIVDGAGDTIARIYGVTEGNPEVQANSHLIAAAPELLEVLQELASATYMSFDTKLRYHPVIGRANIALRKAIGDV